MSCSSLFSISNALSIIRCPKKLTVVKEERPDVLIVSGDIYDNVAPTLAAQRLYNRMLLELHAALPGMKIVVAAGNHDSSSRLDLHSELWDVLWCGQDGGASLVPCAVGRCCEGGTP